MKIIIVLGLILALAECISVKDIKKSPIPLASITKNATETDPKPDSKSTHEMMLPAGEAAVMNNLMKYFSNYSEDILSVVNGRASLKELKIKYQTNRVAFPKRLAGLVKVVRSYFQESLMKIAAPSKSHHSAAANTLKDPLAGCKVCICTYIPEAWPLLDLCKTGEPCDSLVDDVHANFPSVPSYC